MNNSVASKVALNQTYFDRKKDLFTTTVRKVQAELDSAVNESRDDSANVAKHLAQVELTEGNRQSLKNYSDELNRYADPKLFQDIKDGVDSSLSQLSTNASKLKSAIDQFLTA